MWMLYNQLVICLNLVKEENVTLLSFKFGTNPSVLNVSLGVHVIQQRTWKGTNSNQQQKKFLKIASYFSIFTFQL